MKKWSPLPEDGSGIQKKMVQASLGGCQIETITSGVNAQVYAEF
jgi:hypothetical protein